MNRKNKYPGVYKYKKGRFIVHWYDARNIKRSKVLNLTEKQASNWVEEKKNLVHKERIGLIHKSGLYSGKITFEELWNLFSSHYKKMVLSGSITEGAHKRYKVSFKAVKSYKTTLTNKLIENITADDFEGFKAYRVKKNYSPDGINTIIRNMKTIFKFAVDKEILRQSPLKSVKKVKSNTGDVRYLSTEELEKLKKVLENINEESEFEKDGRDLIIFYLLTGARAKEILSDSLKWANVKKDVVELTITKAGKRRFCKKTKTMKKILATRDRKKVGPFDIKYDLAYKRVKALLKKADINDAHIQTLRKTAGAINYLAGRDIFATKEFLGHSSVQVTESHYLGLIQTIKFENADEHEKLVVKYFDL
jgi:integrase/recombinase XerD|tara:strand:- start:712 stop:1803 length:1092 start_codon:yes stop_codon:yes gene_type:complete